MDLCNILSGDGGHYKFTSLFNILSLHYDKGRQLTKQERERQDTRVFFDNNLIVVVSILNKK